jgi:hypothetical protein
VVLFVPDRGRFGELGEGEETRKGDCRILTMANTIQWDPLSLSLPLSLASTTTKGLTKQGKAPKNVVGSTMQYSLLAEVGQWSVRTTKSVPCSVG